MEKTAVEWLREKLWKEFNFSFSDNILEQAKEMEKEQKYTEEDIRESIRRTITYLATLSETGKFHSGNIIEESIIQSLNKQD